MSSFYENPPWPTSARQQTWDPAQIPARPDEAVNPSAGRTTSIPFYHQLEEVDRAIENLKSSNKSYTITPGRRDSVPMMPSRRQFGPDYGMMPSRPYSLTEFDPAPFAPSGPVTPDQLYSAQQRFTPRPIESDPQTKRRAAAARERELRNYHQEQQYNRTTDRPAAGKDNLTGSSGPRSRSNSGSSNPAARSGNASTVQHSRTSASSPSQSPSRIGTSGSVKPQPAMSSAAIKSTFVSRIPASNSTAASAKPNSTPGVPSPLGFGFSNSGSSTPANRTSSNVTSSSVRPSPSDRNKWGPAGNVWNSSTGGSGKGSASNGTSGFGAQSSVWN